MTQANRLDIEHPIQPTWPSGYTETIDDAHKTDLEERFQGIAYDVESVITAIDAVTRYNHFQRQEHERHNLHHLGLSLPPYDQARKPGQSEYESLAGKKDKAGAFIQWFSYFSHNTFVAEENLSKRSFERVSLELGGKRQFGDWEATGFLDDMVRNAPEQLLDLEPAAHITMYDNSRKGSLIHPRITYIPNAPIRYALTPRYDTPEAPNGHALNATYSESERNEEERKYEFNTAIVRRRRPVADIYIDGQSDIVLFKESIGLLVVDLLAPRLRAALYADCKQQLENKQREEASQPDEKSTGTVRFQDTLGSRLAGAVFEVAIKASHGKTVNLLPISAHYVQGVGKEYALFRKCIQDK